ncbi:MAG: hypothetical protein Q4F35_07635 [Akkermansia sp.]|nr:hypothetical protein [Akkermansia sp.]
MAHAGHQFCGLPVYGVILRISGGRIHHLASSAAGGYGGAVRWLLYPGGVCLRKHGVDAGGAYFSSAFYVALTVAGSLVFFLLGTATANLLLKA